MAAQDAVRATAVLRNEVRQSLDRMTYHLGRGAKGRLGWEREVKFLDALARQGARQGALAVGVNAQALSGNFGQQALAAMRGGNSAAIGRAKSSLLGRFTNDALGTARNASLQGAWVWVANASACAACLSEHGTVHTRGLFVAMHPSCMCIPGQPGEARPLSQAEMLKTMDTYGGARVQAQAALVRAGRRSLQKYIRANSVNKSGAGQAAYQADRLRRLSQGALPAPAPSTGNAARTAASTPADEIAALDAQLEAGNAQYLKDYAAASSPEEKSSILQAWTKREGKIADRRRELRQAVKKERDLGNIEFSGTPRTLDPRTWFTNLKNDLVPYSRRVKSGVRVADGNRPAYRLDMSEAGVNRRVKEVVQQFSDDMGIPPPRDIQVIYDWDEWRLVSGKHPNAAAFVDDGVVYIGPSEARALAYSAPEDALQSMRVLAHELSHTASSMKQRGIFNTGLRPIMEEGGAEINSLFWSRYRFADDLLDGLQTRVTVGADYATTTLKGKDSLYWNHNYSDNVEEIILQAARRNGWNRKAMLDDLLDTYRNADDFEDFFRLAPTADGPPAGEAVRIFERLTSKGKDVTDDVAKAWWDAAYAEAPAEATSHFSFLGDFAKVDNTPFPGEALGEASWNLQKQRVGSLIHWLMEGGA